MTDPSNSGTDVGSGSTDICYVVSHGFASRMLVQTDLLGRLREEGHSVALICPDAADPVLRTYCAAAGIALHEFDPKAPWMSEGYMLRRRYVLEDVRGNPVLWEKHLAATRFHVARNPLKWLRPHVNYLTYRLVRLFPSIRRRFARNERNRLRSATATKLLEQIAPKRFVATYPVNYGESVLLNEANAREDTETWIHLLSWDNITCKGRFAALADRYVAWGPVMRDELVEHYGVRPEAIHVCGVPHFDLHHQARVREAAPAVLSTLGLSGQPKILVFAMSSPRFAPNEIDIVEWLAARVEAGEYGKAALVVRPHPQNVSGTMADRSWLPRLERLAARVNVAVAWPKLVASKMPYSMQSDDMVELSALLAASSIVINSGSTVSIDALHHDKPVIVTAFDGDLERDYWDSARRLMDYPHLKKLRELGGLLVAGDFDELDRLIRESIADPSRTAAARRRALEAECHLADGSATARVVEALCSP